MPLSWEEQWGSPPPGAAHHMHTHHTSDEARPSPHHAGDITCLRPNAAVPPPPVFLTLCCLTRPNAPSSGELTQWLEREGPDRWSTLVSV